MCLQSDERNDLLCFGASVAGPLHRQEKKGRQDAWLAASGSYGVVLVVCDGMGSRSKSRFGADVACRAVRDAIRAHAHAGRAYVPQLLRLIHSLWSVRILPAAADDCATTCLFAAVFPWGQLVVAQLGDGMAALANPDGTLAFVESSERVFGNVTTGLGIARSTAEWAVLTRDVFSPGSAVMLATDGISDDLRHDSVMEFIAHVIAEYSSMPPKRRSRALRSELERWPTPHHLDDKTLAVLWNRRGAPTCG